MNADPSPLSLRALALAQAALSDHVRGGQPGRFQGPEVTAYLEWAGVTEPAPWCASAVGYLHATAASEIWLDSPVDAGPPVNLCPRTPVALHLAELAPAQCHLQGPRPGAVFVENRGHGKGHCGFVECVGPLPGQVTTVEPDTNAAGDTRGDAWGRHTWSPANMLEERGGTLVGWFDFGVAP